jgi:hypothetical protein
MPSRFLKKITRYRLMNWRYCFGDFGAGGEGAAAAVSPPLQSAAKKSAYL